MPESFNLGAEPTIKIESVENDVHMVGWENEEILIKISDDDSLTSQQDEDNLVISCSDSLSLNVPKDAKVNVVKVDGDMSVRGLNGQLDVDFIAGDVALRDVGQVSIGTIESDFNLRGAKGDVHVKSVGGDASIRAVDGDVTITSISDDLAVRDLGGNLEVDVDDDVVAHLDPKPDQEYSIVAGDDIMLVLPEDADATLNLSGEKISVNFPGVELDDSSTQSVILGEGGAKIDLNAGTRLLVTTRANAAESADEFGNFAGMMFDWGSWGREIGEYWGNFGREMGEHMSQRAQRAARRAERKMRHIAGRRNAKMKWTWDLDKMTKASKREPVSEEERMTILRMLAENKITSDEAEQLLSSLEGGQ